MAKSSLLRFFLVGVSGYLLVGCGGSSGGGSIPGSLPAANELRIGGLFSLTGNWNTLGKASKAAMELARDDVNAYFSSRSIPTRVTLFISDTKLQPETAVTQLNGLVDRQVRYVVGPQSSSEVARLKATADSSGTLLISQGSTASSLSIADDNVFRMVPDDVREAKALVALARADGIQALIPVARDDAGNGGLFNSVSAGFSGAGGEVATGIRYGASETNFTATLDSVRAAIVSFRTTHTDAQIGVYLAGFDEDAQILALAQADPILSAVKWYGSDGVVSSAALTSNAGSAAFMAQHGFPSPIFGLDDSAVGTWSPVAQRIKAKSGVDPDAFALSAYDAVWLAALSYQAAGGSSASATQRRTLLFTTASTYTGVTGPTKFDASGDRNDGNFDFWSVGGTTGNYHWMRVASYKAADGSIVRIP